MEVPKGPIVARIPTFTMLPLSTILCLITGVAEALHILHK